MYTHVHTWRLDLLHPNDSLTLRRSEDLSSSDKCQMRCKEFTGCSFDKMTQENGQREQLRDLN